MADENEQQSACEAGRDEQHCKCRQRRAAAEAAAENASAAQQPAAHHCTCKHDGAAEAGDEQPKHCACKHDAEGHAISTEPHLGYVADLASLIEIQPESTVSRVVMREDGLRVVLFVFTGYLTVTGVISGSADAAAVRATKAAVSGMVPVVGSILSDASETLLASASALKSSMGVFGMLAVLAICLTPFLKIGAQYLLLKGTAAVSGTIGMPQQVKLVKHAATAMGYLLAMTGACALMLLISVVCFLKVVG